MPDDRQMLLHSILSRNFYIAYRKLLNEIDAVNDMSVKNAEVAV